MSGKVIAGGVIGALTAAYTFYSMYSHDGSDFKIVMNKGNAQSVSNEGLGFALGLYDKVYSLPRVRQITSVGDGDITIRSKDGEEFVGGVRVEYEFDFPLGGEPDGLAKIEQFFRNFNVVANQDSFWDVEQVDPVEKTIKARTITATNQVFATIATDEYQNKMVETSANIRNTLQKIISDEGLQIKVVSVDISGISPSQSVQQRIDRIASERREGVRAQVVVDNANKVGEAAKAEAGAIMAFTEALRQKGYSDETIVQLNCQRLSDKADRFGLPFTPGCSGAFQPSWSIAVDPKNPGAVQPRDNIPAAPTP